MTEHGIPVLLLLTIVFITLMLGIIYASALRGARKYSSTRVYRGFKWAFPLCGLSLNVGMLLIAWSFSRSFTVEMMGTGAIAFSAALLGGATYLITFGIIGIVIAPLCLLLAPLDAKGYLDRFR